MTTPAFAIEQYLISQKSQSPQYSSNSQVSELGERAFVTAVMDRAARGRWDKRFPDAPLQAPA
jgi:hypothetical protein